MLRPLADAFLESELDVVLAPISPSTPPQWPTFACRALLPLPPAPPAATLSAFLFCLRSRSFLASSISTRR